MGRGLAPEQVVLHQIIAERDGSLDRLHIGLENLERSVRLARGNNFASAYIDGLDPGQIINQVRRPHV